MAPKKSARTVQKHKDISDMDVEGMIAAVKEAAERAPNQEAAKAMKKHLGKALRDKIEQLEAVCEAEFEREMAQLREMRRNLPSAVANLTIGQIRDAGGYFGPDADGNACFEIPAHLYRPASSAADPSETENKVVASAKKMIQQQMTHSKRMSKRTRSVMGTPGSVIKSKVPKLAAPAGATAIRHSVRQSTRTLRSTVKGGKKSNASQSSVSASFLSSTEEPAKGSQKGQNRKPRETEFEDALQDGFTSSQDTAVKGKKKTTRSSKKETSEASASTATGAATANTTLTGTPVDEVQKQLLNMSIANPRTPTGKHRILPKPVRLPKDNEPVVTIHVSKDGTPLLISKKQLDQQ
jgi:hypothetical protein